MPIPSQIHRDAALENVSVAYRSNELVADAAFPGLPVSHDTNIYYQYAKNSLSVPQTYRGNGAPANRATWEITTGSYALIHNALKDLVTDRDRNNADTAIQLDVDVTEYLVEKILLRKEVDLATLCGTAANWANTTSLTSTFAWTANTTLSNPITFVDSASSVIAQQAGKIPNTVILDRRTFMAANEHFNVVERIKYTSADSITPSLLGKLFNIPFMFVAGGVSNTGVEGLTETTTAMNFIWTDMAWVGYVERAPGLRKVSSIYQFCKAEEGNPYKVKRWREEELEGDMIEVDTMYQFKVVASDAAYLIVNTCQ
jgi:hypothetical protein